MILLFIRCIYIYLPFCSLCWLIRYCRSQLNRQQFGTYGCIFYSLFYCLICRFNGVFLTLLILFYIHYREKPVITNVFRCGNLQASQTQSDSQDRNISRIGVLTGSRPLHEPAALRVPPPPPPINNQSTWCPSINSSKSMCTKT